MCRLASILFILSCSQFYLGVYSSSSSSNNDPKTTITTTSSSSSSTTIKTKANDATTTLPMRSIGEMEDETGFFQSIAITEDSPIYNKKSKYQDIAVYNAKSYYGRILALDGVVQLTERDANAYNEMMTHIPMFQHNEPKRVLIIGGGDGYVLSEVLKHPSVEHVDHVDLDEEVINVCKEYFSWGNAWNDKRVTLHIQDGAEFVRKTKSSYYDVIIQDSSDPWTWEEKDGTTSKVILPSSVLYEDKHFIHIHRILKPNGMFNMQAETFQIPSDLDGISEWRNKALRIGFERVRYGSLYISSYPTGQIGFLLCEKNNNDIASSSKINNDNSSESSMFLAQKKQLSDIRKRHTIMQEQTETKTTYYHPGLQQSSFELPLWVHNEIYGEDPDAITCINTSSSHSYDSSS